MPRRRRRKRYKPTKHQVVIDRRRHAKMRARQRYGIALNRQQYDALIWQIVHGGAQFLRKRTNRLSEWIVHHRWQEDGVNHAVSMMVLYDKVHGMINTFLDKERLEQWQTRLKDQAKQT